MMKSCLPVLRPVLALCLGFACLALSGCVVSKKSHPENVRTVSLASFAGTYDNYFVNNHGNHSFTLTSVIWPKHPPVTPGRDYRNIDRVRVTVEGKVVKLTFLAWGKVFDEVSYVEGRDFRLSDSAVSLQTHATAAAKTRLSGGGEEMAGMIPIPPAMGAAVQTGQLFLNEKGDIVVRYDTTSGIMVFYVLPVIGRDGEDTVFRRISEEEDRLANYGAPRKRLYEFNNPSQIHDELNKLVYYYRENSVSTAWIGQPADLLSLRKNDNSHSIEVTFLVRWERIPDPAATWAPAKHDPLIEPPRGRMLYSTRAERTIRWLNESKVNFTKKPFEIQSEGRVVAQKLILTIDCKTDAGLAGRTIYYMTSQVFGGVTPVRMERIIE